MRYVALLTPELKPYAAMKTPTPAWDEAFVQHNEMMPEENVANIQELNFPYLSAIRPGRTRPKREAPFTIEVV